MKTLLCRIVVLTTVLMAGLGSASLAMDGYIVCGTCKYFDPGTRSCQDAPDCYGYTEGYGYDCGHCATWYADNERGHCETIPGCGGATSASWPQVLYGENQATVAH
ncbi:MAG: hypothetical protein FJ146_10880 [Deltaproteobacteria bacterium]|nr:hypothetical protein [Deltaproteobacteria bacterium]